MGVMMSSMEGYVNAHYMSAGSTLDFYLDQVKLAQKMQWAGVVQQQAAMQSAGIYGNGGGGFNNQFGISYNFWKNLNYGIHSITSFFLFATLLATGLTIGLKSSPALVLIFSFFFFFFLGHGLLYMADSAQNDHVTMRMARNAFLVGAFGGLATMLIYMFTVYNKREAMIAFTGAETVPHK